MLKKEHKDIRFEQVGYLSCGVGRAMFYEYDRRNYNAIYPPK